MLKIIQLILFLILFSFSSIAQDRSGRIVDANTNNYIKNALLINLETSDTIFSNSKGYFKIIDSGKYKIIKFNYFEKNVFLDIKKFKTIRLQYDPSVLDEVVIKSNHLPKPLRKATSAVEIIGDLQIERFNNTDYSKILNSTPGIFMQSGALNTNRITIRGIGSRNLFGTSKIRAYFMDIPLTNGNGDTTIEDFELGSISEIEIIKGATSSSYGAGLGGTIILKPKIKLGSPTQLKSEVSFGSFGLIKNITSFNLGLEKSSINAVFSTTFSEGYRENNDYNRNTFTIASKQEINSKNDISLLISLVKLKAFIPSSLDKEDFINNPEIAASAWHESKGFEDTNRAIIGFTWNHILNSKLKHITSVFTSFRDAYEPRPFNILSENSFGFGLRSRLIGNLKLLDKKLSYTFGGEIFRDYNISKTFENLYQDFDLENGSVQGNMLSDFKETRNYYNIFFESDYQVSNKISLTLGVNYNKTAYDLKDYFLTSEDNPDQSGKFKFKSILSPKLGISYSPSDYFSFFSSISQGFSPISLNETLLPNGQINPSLKPETGWNYEIGSRGLLLKKRIHFTISLYRLNISNLVVSRRTEQDQFIGINAGKTIHDGLELKLQYNRLNSGKINIYPYVISTFNNYKFDEFLDGESNFSGNDLTGVPCAIFNAGTDWNFDFGLYGNLNFQYVGEMPITDDNSIYNDAYNLTNLKFGYKSLLLKKINFNVFFGINNLFDNRYASQILINATGFNGAAPRYYYPGNPINYYSGFRLNYDF